MAQLNDWLSIDNISGTGNAEITLTASSYQELVDRTATIKVQGIGTNAILTVRQKAYSPIEKNNDYFWVEFEETGGEVYIGSTISGNVPGGTYSDFEYSFDGLSWSSVFSTKNNRIYFEMGNNTLVYMNNKSGILNNYSTTPYDFKWESIHFSKNAKVGGALNTLAQMGEAAYRAVFSGNKYLTDASELILEETVSKRCYETMFGGCTSLVIAPELPATTLALDCYYEMFSGCASLTTAPALPATTLATECYGYMFRNCTSLVTIPELPLTTLASSCYRGMFFNCTSLVTAPELPATTVTDYCYYEMFNGCTSLTTAPALPATTLANSCYRKMFQGCTSLVTAPVLPATSLEDSCYYYMFTGCARLNYIKMLGRYGINATNLNEWVYGIPSKGTFIKNEKADFSNIKTEYDGIPKGWTVYNEGDPNIPDPDTPNPVEELKQQYFWVEFEETYGKVSIKDAKVSYSFDGNTWTYNAANISMGDNTIVYLQGLNNTTNNKAKIQFTKKAKVGGDLSSLKEIGDSAFKYLFLNNTYLTDASALILPWTTLANGCYYSMFKGCTSLVAAPTLPATTLAKDCYYNMFYGCIRLVSAPTLPATTLVVYCYGRMFAGCTNLNYIKMLATDISADSCLASWVDGVASTGTFVKHPDTNLPTGYDGIPNGWAVETATE